MRPGVAVHAGDGEFTISSIRPAGEAWLVVLEEVQSRDEAEALRGLLLEVPDKTIAPEEDAHFVYDLIGMVVYTDSGEELGVVEEVLQPGGNDVYVVRGARGEVLIPVIEDVVRQIDQTNRRIVITPLPGLLNDSL